MILHTPTIRRALSWTSPARRLLRRPSATPRDVSLALPLRPVTLGVALHLL